MNAIETFNNYCNNKKQVFDTLRNTQEYNKLVELLTLEDVGNRWSYELANIGFKYQLEGYMFWDLYSSKHRYEDILNSISELIITIEKQKRALDSKEEEDIRNEVLNCKINEE